MLESDMPKQCKRNAELIPSKSSKQLADEWGINLRENLFLEGKILNQPTYFNISWFKN